VLFKLAELSSLVSAIQPLDSMPSVSARLAWAVIGHGHVGRPQPVRIRPMPDLADGRLIAIN
jgi:hypothetical protein